MTAKTKDSIDKSRIKLTMNTIKPASELHFINIF
jgi:hypothetical protein